MKITFNGRGYSLSSIQEDEHPTIPDNYLLARNRLSYSLNLSKLRPELLQKYENVIKEQFNGAVVELIELSVEEKVCP